MPGPYGQPLSTKKISKRSLINILEGKIQRREMESVTYLESIVTQCKCVN